MIRLGFDLGYAVYPRSVVETVEGVLGLARGSEGKVLLILGQTGGFTGRRHGETLVCSLSAANAQAIRQRLPWLRPVPLGLQTSAGCGDRLGLATPGHVRALRVVGGIAPILAQQSMRENARTGRTPQQVMDDAMWGVAQEGWRLPWGADADHLKTTDDVDLCVAAGYTFFTIDPGAYVDNAAHTDSTDRLRAKYAELPWQQLEDSPEAMRRRYLREPRLVESVAYAFDEPALLRAACKYSAAIAHTASMARYLTSAKRGDRFDLEISVDETETPTSPLEHIFVASELRRLGVAWVSLAPRYIGRFEKGVDYIGDPAAFDADIAEHARIARALGPYKLSIHSGSDKFSIYASFAKHTGLQVHLKTAGTSYLEALRTVARVDPQLFRQILALALDRYVMDRATYHVSADVSRIPRPADLSDAQLPGVLDDFHGREALHVTFGSALAAFGARLRAVLDSHEEAHYDVLQAHFLRHLAPFGAPGLTPG